MWNRLIDGCQQLAVLGLLGALSPGCLKDVETEFPDGMGPLDAVNLATFPSDDAETMSTTGEATEDWVSVHGRGYVHAPITAVWAALQDSAVDTDRRRVDEWLAEDLADDNVDRSYVIHTTVKELISVDYDLTWRHSVVEGTATEPEVVAIRWQKTFGAAIIEVIEGSITLRNAGDELVEIEVIEHLGAPNQNAEDIELFIVDLHADAVAFSKDLPLPEFE